MRNKFVAIYLVVGTGDTSDGGCDEVAFMTKMNVMMMVGGDTILTTLKTVSMIARVVLLAVARTMTTVVNDVGNSDGGGWRCGDGNDYEDANGNDNGDDGDTDDDKKKY